MPLNPLPPEKGRAVGEGWNGGGTLTPGDDFFGYALGFSKSAAAVF